MSIQYYQDNADDFFENTIGVDMEELYLPFVDLLPNNALILDAGCGSGRDSKAFLDKGFRVDAIDASSEMVKRARIVTGLDVQLKRFDQVDDVERYDAIWSCASLLHVPEGQLLETIKVLSRSLKPNGVWYASFKYGIKQREKGGRLFTDMDECRFNYLTKNLVDLKLKSLWKTTDKRPDRDEIWLNIIIKKSH
ncbi:class I SAM-dependent methyltransferase [Shewanella abyssi]|uniref:class I SAM-dependent methyltransferase n=1 Tax=Shewanella abyssi TaxID=311789 RepID=UPI00200E43B5|nr:class I SAM-dependent methyltransferase [Shewanella abyssi]MCL1049844.1 class I SAM-dependent methyltransferase [Shewanella abyssi]